MPLTDLSEFFKLSATLNYQLGAVGVGNRNILTIIMGKAHLSRDEEEILLDVLSYLEKAYGDHRRRLGPQPRDQPSLKDPHCAWHPGAPTTVALAADHRHLR